MLLEDNDLKLKLIDHLTSFIDQICKYMFNKVKKREIAYKLNHISMSLKTSLFACCLLNFIACLFSMIKNNYLEKKDR